MSEFLGNIYDRSVAIVFETVYFSTFWRLWKLFFSQKTFQNLVLIFSFYQKNGRTGSRKTSMTQAWLVTEICSEICPSLGNVFNLLSIDVRYAVSF